MQPPVRWPVATPKPLCGERPGLGLKAAAGSQCGVAPRARGVSSEGTTLAPLTIGHGPSQHS